MLHAFGNPEVKMNCLLQKQKGHVNWMTTSVTCGGFFPFFFLFMVWDHLKQERCCDSLLGPPQQNATD